MVILDYASTLSLSITYSIILAHSREGKISEVVSLVGMTESRLATNLKIEQQKKPQSGLDSWTINYS